MPPLIRPSSPRSPVCKRPLSTIDSNMHPTKPKRARFAHPEAIPNDMEESITVKPQMPPSHRLARDCSATAQSTAANAPARKTTNRARGGRKGKATAKEKISTAEGVRPKPRQQSPTLHQKKIRSGILHELDKLQGSRHEPSPAKLAQDKPGRRLRSQAPSRFKSELSAYFPDYDEVIGNDPKSENHILNLDTPMLVLDSQRPVPAPPSRPGSKSPQESTHGGPPSDEPNHAPHHTTSAGPSSASPTNLSAVRCYADALFTDLNDSYRIDFGFLETRYTGKEVEDPLPDSYYEVAHKKSERLEKSIRNGERARAHHERHQIVRLLSELQGYEWLRTMGVSGVTESRKKTFEPARDYFIQGCEAILEKFRWWSQQEKMQKLDRERAATAEAYLYEADETEEAAEERAGEEVLVNTDHLMDVGQQDTLDSVTHGDSLGGWKAGTSVAEQPRAEIRASMSSKRSRAESFSASLEPPEAEAAPRKKLRQAEPPRRSRRTRSAMPQEASVPPGSRDTSQAPIPMGPDHRSGKHICHSCGKPYKRVYHLQKHLMSVHGAGSLSESDHEAQEGPGVEDELDPPARPTRRLRLRRPL